MLSPILFLAKQMMAYIQEKPSREGDRICSGLKLKLDGPQIN